MLKRTLAATALALGLLATAAGAQQQDAPVSHRNPTTTTTTTPAQPAAPARTTRSGRHATTTRPAPPPTAENQQHHVLNLRPIEPDNALEYAFVAALDNPQMRPAFRQRLLDSPVALATQGVDDDAPLLLVPLQGGVHAVAIFTSPSRLTSVLGPAADFVTITGREALRRAGDEHVVINYGLMPMLTLDPPDVAHFLAIPTEPQQ